MFGWNSWEFMCNSWSVCTDLENIPLCYVLLVGQSIVTKVTSLARKPAAPQTNRGIFSNWFLRANEWVQGSPCLRKPHLHLGWLRGIPLLLGYDPTADSYQVVPPPIRSHNHQSTYIIHHLSMTSPFSTGLKTPFSAGFNPGGPSPGTSSRAASWEPLLTLSLVTIGGSMGWSCWGVPVTIRAPCLVLKLGFFWDLQANQLRYHHNNPNEISFLMTI